MRLTAATEPRRTVFRAPPAPVAVRRPPLLRLRLGDDNDPEIRIVGVTSATLYVRHVWWIDLPFHYVRVPSLHGEVQPGSNKVRLVVMPEEIMLLEVMESAEWHRVTRDLVDSQRTKKTLQSWASFAALT